MNSNKRKNDSDIRGEFHRDYIVSPNTVKEFVATFLLKDDDDSICEEMRERAERTSSVLHNAYSESVGIEASIAQQYYCEENWMLPKKPQFLLIL